MDIQNMETNFCQEDAQRNAVLEELLCLAAATAIMQLKPKKEHEEKKERKKKRKTVWVREWLLQRTDFCQYEKLLQQLHDEDVKSFKILYRNHMAMWSHVHAKCSNS